MLVSFLQRLPKDLNSVLFEEKKSFQLYVCLVYVLEANTALAAIALYSLPCASVAMTSCVKNIKTFPVMKLETIVDITLSFLQGQLPSLKHQTQLLDKT